jgi:sulfur-oxidizing protein SoxB
VNLGVAGGEGKPPHLVGDKLLQYFGIGPGSREAHAFTFLDFPQAARTYGRIGGFAHLATLVKKLRASRPSALLLDGGDTWQGSATALWTRGQDMVDAQTLLGVDVMSGHWEFTLGAERVKHVVEHDFKGRTEFLAQNVRTTDFEDPVFAAWTLREVRGVPVAIIGQAFPYTPIANPRYFVPEWSFGIREESLQKTVDEARGKGAHAVVLLSHNGMDVDLKLAGRVTGIDAILGGHTHDGVPAPVIVTNPGGRTLVTNAGSNGKFLGVLDLSVRERKVVDYRYRLLPVFANLLPADVMMAAHIAAVRAPFAQQLAEPLAVTETLLYRRGNFNGPFDQVALEALLDVKGAQIAFSPGFRWGGSLLPGDTITMEHVLAQTAIMYPYTTVNDLTGAQIKAVLEDVADNLFNPDPYYQQGGDMVRVGGLTYAITPRAAAGAHISDMRLGGRPIDAAKAYRVASWAPVAEEAKTAGGEPMSDVLARYLRAKKTVKTPVVNQPRLIGVAGNPGLGSPPNDSPPTLGDPGLDIATHVGREHRRHRIPQLDRRVMRRQLVHRRERRPIPRIWRYPFVTRIHRRQSELGRAISLLGGPAPPACGNFGVSCRIQALGKHPRDDELRDGIAGLRERQELAERRGIVLRRPQLHAATLVSAGELAHRQPEHRQNGEPPRSDSHAGGASWNALVVINVAGVLVLAAECNALLTRGSTIPERRTCSTSVTPAYQGG